MKTGFFGKLPSYGDFIQRNLSPDIVNHWDNWLLTSIEAAHASLSDQWRNRYFSGPMWRFVIDQPLIDESVVTGVMMPSVDKAGRCYPFSIMCQTEMPVNPFSLARHVDPLHLQAEEFLLTLLDDQQIDLDQVADVLSGIYAPLDELACCAAQSAEPASTMELSTLVASPELDLSQCNETLLHELLKRQHMHITIWSMFSEQSTIRYFAGMPPVDVFHTFLSG